MPSSAEQFSQAALHWKLETLYADLASAKGKRLTPVEKLHLRGLLCGYSPAEIARNLHKSVKGVESELCTTLYIYVKSLTGKQDQKVENWRNITDWLDEAGYKNYQLSQGNLSGHIPVDIVGKIANITIGKDKIKIEIDLKSSELPDSDFLPQDFDSNNSLKSDGELHSEKNEDRHTENIENTV